MSFIRKAVEKAYGTSTVSERTIKKMRDERLAERKR